MKLSLLPIQVDWYSGAELENRKYSRGGQVGGGGRGKKKKKIQLCMNFWLLKKVSTTSHDLLWKALSIIRIQSSESNFGIYNIIGMCYIDMQMKMYH